VGGWVGGEKLRIKLNSAQLELDLGLSLAISGGAFYSLLSIV
jgi:hypothetical protein